MIASVRRRNEGCEMDLVRSKRAEMMIRVGSVLGCWHDFEESALWPILSNADAP
jgi:hypothetical protein